MSAQLRHQIRREIANGDLPFELDAPRMDPITYQGVTYERRRGVMCSNQVECLLTSEFGILRPAYGNRAHTGTDWGAVAMNGKAAIWKLPPAEVVVAAQDFLGLGWGYFMAAKFRDRKGRLWLLLSAHLKYRPIVNAGDKLRRGYTYGFINTTGTATGAHHHLTLALAEDFDSDPSHPNLSDGERYAEFWRSPRDDDAGISRLWGINDFMVDELSQPDPIFVEPGEPMDYHALVLAVTDAYIPFFETGAIARLEVRWNPETQRNEHVISLSLEDQATFNARYAEESGGS